MQGPSLSLVEQEEAVAVLCLCLVVCVYVATTFPGVVTK